MSVSGSASLIPQSMFVFTVPISSRTFGEAFHLNPSRRIRRFINVYLPTKMANSDNQYQENLDILQTMIDKYVDSHTIIICGDMNGSLSIERNDV
jgi:exonuclease III